MPANTTDTIFMIAYEEWGEHNKIATIREFGAWKKETDAQAEVDKLNDALIAEQRQRYDMEYDAYLYGIREHNVLVSSGLRDKPREDTFRPFIPKDTPCFKVVRITLNHE